MRRQLALQIKLSVRGLGGQRPLSLRAGNGSSCPHYQSLRP